MPEEKFVPALQRTKNFFELYQHICGKSEVPAVYHFWASVSLLSAAVEGRIWFEKFKNKRLYPNLYIFLIGPGGLGKGTAIDQAADLAEKSIRVDRYRGSATSASLIDILGKVEENEYGQKILTSPRLWLIMDELKNNLGTNIPLVEAFIALMTELYTATGYRMNTSTRKYGKIDVDMPIINWLIGTTENDLREILTRKLIDTGFTARVCFIFGDYNFDLRCPKITYPPDYDEVLQHLQMRLWMLQGARGQVLMTSDAEALQDKWYMTRPNPEDEAIFSTWKRSHDMLLKFAMLNAVADGGPLVIRTVHLQRAKSMVNAINKSTERLLEVAHETPWTKTSSVVAKYLKKKGEVGHSEALRYFRAKKGMVAKTFRQSVDDLVQEKQVERGRTSTGGTYYKWIGD